MRILKPDRYRIAIFSGLILAFSFASGAPCAAATRHYYIAAEDVTWDFAPSGRNLIDGGIIPQPWTLRTKWQKTRFIEYTDSTFSTRKPQPESLGILGPIIRAEVGDTILVDFFNRGHTPHNLHAHGVRYDKDNEGSMYLPMGKGGSVGPGKHFIYHWFADEGSGPGPGELSSKVWWYHGHVDEPIETNAGLLGPIVITARGKARPDGSPKDADREFVTLFMIFDELQGKDGGLFYSINGYIYGNLPGLVMKKGEKVRWYLLGMGNEKDLHSAHWHGKTVSNKLRTTDVIELMPGSMVTMDMLADNPGVWMYHCHVADHMEFGMMATYTIYQPATRPCPVKFNAGELWKTPDNFSVTVDNQSAKAIKNLELEADNFQTAQYLTRPFQGSTWSSDELIAPGKGETLRKKAYPLAAQQNISGWVFVPKAITFVDGSTWKPESDNECFQIFWRDDTHPKYEVLPPVQKELNAD